MTGRGPALPGRLARSLRGAGLSGAALAGRHGLKDLWQHRHHYVANTRWWPPFCLVVDWVAAAILVLLIDTGVHFHH